MSQPGYGFDVPTGYHRNPTYPNPSYPPFPPAPQYLGEPSDAAAQRHGNTAQPPSYQHPRNVIPGLGLGFSSGELEQQNSWLRGPENWYSAPPHPQAADPSSRQAPSGHGDLNMSGAMEPGAGVADDLSEEGEVSEGEIGDIYEPKEGDDRALVIQAGADLAGSAGQGQGNATSTEHDVVAPGQFKRPQASNHGEGGRSANRAGPSNVTRERSGSYSPYLSPREIDMNVPEHTLNKPGSLDSDGPAKKPPSRTGLPKDSSHAISTRNNTVTLFGDAVDVAKRKAGDAILRIWPLNIRYENFLDEGIDGAILRPLLKDLGLGVHERPITPEEPDVRDAATAEPAAAAEPAAVAKPATTTKSDTAMDMDENSSSDEPVSSATANKEIANSLDKSEERKDRIARLLAAKGSKAAAPVPLSQTTSSCAPTTILTKATNASPKVQSEKSKLLHQKMEALRRSREGLAKTRNQQASSINSNTGNPEAEKTLTPDIAIASVDTSEEPSSSSTTRASGSCKPSPSIPGLFLSSTPQLLQDADSLSQHRPTPNLVDASAQPIRRPFSQTMESKPFLINVSDDEDDAEMEIDSPGRPSSADRQDTPSQRARALREPSLAMNNMIPGQGLTPTAAVTPPRSSGHNSGGEDLASMNKKIEAMKRKIAEAEARKKTKLSRQVSPAASQLNDSSRSGSIEAGSIAKGVNAPSTPLDRCYTPTNDRSVDDAPASMPHERAGRPQKREQDAAADRRSRSMVASERLPFIEARRREQLLKLKSLQSQITNIEREIAEGMKEEEILKQDLIASESDHDPIPASSAPAPSSATNAAQADDGMNSAGDTLVIDQPLANSDSQTAMEVVEGGKADINRQPLDNENDIGRTANADQPATTGAIETGSSAPPEGLELGPSQGQEKDIVMEDADDVTDQDSDQGSDDYEPPDVDPSTSQDAPSSLPQPPSVDTDRRPSSSEHAPRRATVPTPVSQHVPPSQAQTTLETEDSSRQLLSDHPIAEQARGQSQNDASDPPRSNFVPYETPLQYFRAFRFHPDFGKSVAGGLRSLTYSNKIDVRKELCPDELAGQPCPRGGQCEYQHFDTMKAPDDQILLQLGAAGSYQDAQKQEYISGLRQLLTEFRNRKVKDFNTISRGIIDYRAQFLGDKSKILPLGGVSI